MARRIPALGGRRGRAVRRRRPSFAARSATLPNSPRRRCAPAASSSSRATAAAADAQHIGGELGGRLNHERAPLAGVALTTDSSVLTALANDWGYERVFERKMRGLGRAGDVLIAISTSGRSPNILRAIAAAREQRLRVVGPHRQERRRNGSSVRFVPAPVGRRDATHSAAPHHRRAHHRRRDRVPLVPARYGQEQLLNGFFRPECDIYARIGRCRHSSREMGWGDAADN